MVDVEELAQKFAHPIINLLMEAVPVLIAACQASYRLYKKIPMPYVQLMIGAVMCFFGGVYPTVFAALQAAEYGGLVTARKALCALSEEAIVIIEENKKDNEVDDDGDGIPDAQQISGKELVKRKARLVIQKMDPEKVNDAISSLYKVWLSVLAVLKIKFARTIALSLTISDFLGKIADRLLLPVLARATPPEYAKWPPVMMGWFCKSVGISIAWRIQEVISAFTSALAGGLIMSRALILIVYGGKKDHDDTRMDEVASYVLAGLGFRFQYHSGFDAPFPLNVILWPVELAEWYIRWAVTEDM